jgi:hypothetical protein
MKTWDIIYKIEMYRSFVVHLKNEYAQASFHESHLLLHEPSKRLFGMVDVRTSD